MNPTSFEAWLVGEIRKVLNRKITPPPWILWCDPNREWLDLLRTAAADAGFELWAPAPGEPEPHELLMRERVYGTAPAARVVWIPLAKDDITWFKVYELQATLVWESPLLAALREYGVEIRREDEADLAALLAPHAREWFGNPRTAWRELTVGNAKGTLVSSERILEALAGPGGVFAELAREGRFNLFARRVVEEFGLPVPAVDDEHGWRVASVARLLATDAAAAVPNQPPAEGDRVIPPGLIRGRALGLLKSWQTHIGYLNSFEKLVPLADATLGLQWWARNLSQPPRSRSSRVVEAVLMDQLLERLEREENVEKLATLLEGEAATVQHRAGGFWSTNAKGLLGWGALAGLVEAACLLVETQAVEKEWKSVGQAIDWYTGPGWRIDEAGERLFAEDASVGGALHRLRVRLRRAYLRATDRIGARFSELLAARPGELTVLPTAGEVVAEEVERRKGPLAILFLDACRYDLGCRLAALLNDGEPVPRAQVRASVAPIPSITALGMAYALPIPRASLHVALTADNKTFRVTADGFSGDLSRKDERRRWLTEKLGVQTMLSINEVLEGDVPTPGKSKRVIAVHGAEFDTEGHEGQLALEGADDHIARYASAVRRLRDRGYGRIVVVTDHGFFHWQPERDELEGEKPAGAVRWSSRRAIVGNDLKHKTALTLPVTGSDLDAAIPRSVNAWKTYGGVGFFHGGATLQELVIPAVIVSWPVRMTKVELVLKPVGHITSRTPRVQVQVGSTSLIAGEGQVARRVAVRVEDATGREVFVSSEPVLFQPPSSMEHREPKTIQLDLVSSPPPVAFGDSLVVIVLDADDKQRLVVENVTLKVELDEW